MADTTTFRRALVSYVSAAGFVAMGEVRPSTDAAVVANPQYWSALSDTEIVKYKVH